jgi:hypothetical protein
MGTEPPVLATQGDSGMSTRPQRPGRRALSRLALRPAGGGLLIATGAIHLDLYLTGYSSIPTIGWLFLLQVIAAFGLGAAVLGVGAGCLRRPGPCSPWPPWAATCCHCGPACSGSPRSAPPRGSGPG